MIFQRINRSNPERAFITALNGYSTAALTNGQPVMWDIVAGDGVSVTMCSGTKRAIAFAGKVAQTIGGGDYWLVQVWGYHSAVIVTDGTTANIHTGMCLFMRTGAFHLLGGWLASGTTEEQALELVPAAFAIEAYTVEGTTSTIKAFVKAL